MPPARTRIPARTRKDIPEAGAPVCFTYAWCTAGGRVTTRAGAAGLWVNLCYLGTHIPVFAPAPDLTPLNPGNAATFGLCAECLGYGTLAPLPPTVPLQLAAIEDPCGECGGSGRTALRAIRYPLPGFAVRTSPARNGPPQLAEKTGVTLVAVPHPARRLPGRPGVDPWICVACALRADDPATHPVSVTHDAGRR